MPLAHSVSAYITKIKYLGVRQDGNEAISYGLDGFRYFSHCLELYNLGRYRPDKAYPDLTSNARVPIRYYALKAITVISNSHSEL